VVFGRGACSWFLVVLVNDDGCGGWWRVVLLGLVVVDGDCRRWG
jgi:hypothetical protein